MEMDDKVQKCLHEDKQGFERVAHSPHTYNLRRARTLTVRSALKSSQFQQLEGGPKTVSSKKVPKTTKFQKHDQKKLKNDPVISIRQAYAKKIKYKIYKELGLAPIINSDPDRTQSHQQILEEEGASETVVSQSMLAMSKAFKVVKKRESNIRNLDLEDCNVEFVRICNAIDQYFI